MRSRSRPRAAVSRAAVSRVAGQAGVVLALVALAAVVSVVAPNDPWHDFFDLRVYRGAVASWLEGRPLYDYTYGRSPYGFTYPPFAALLVAPMAVLPYAAVATGHTLLNLAVLAGLAWWLVTPLARRHGRPLPFAWLAALPVLFVLEPVRETIGFGQVNLLLAALVLADVAALRRGSRWAGVGTGLAAAVKLTPGLFVVYLLLTGRRRAAGVAAATAAAATLLAFAVAPATSWRFWTQTLWQTERVGRLDKTSNQSLLGGLARLTDPADPPRAVWAVLAAVVLVAVVARAVRAARAGDELAGVALTGLAACLVSPISWSHHFVWLVPALVVLVDVAAGSPTAPGRWQARSRVAAGALAAVAAGVLASSAIWFAEADPGSHHDLGVAGLLVEDLWLLLTLVVVVALPVRAGRAAARTTAPSPPAGSSPR
ncbi:alpha-1,2-mannosyltransferase [Geodermatophilus telluris]|uniref:Alpha-1,2-mannosyltransferase n=1 Tax=Geodermatophilus telluris TaxID=1190417 RepID=A0A1G6LDV1_9ACTN|nr:glycosyltransferase 87 family protein [Geodermatophilus telluris]SDC41373.1 alpha-1,2-mannosyltransferase [Geodermatophilus telluris]